MEDANDMHTPVRLALIAPVVLSATLVACGSLTPASTSTSTSRSAATAAAVPPTATPPAAATPTPAAGLTSLTCPTEDTVNSGLGVNVAAPMSQPAGDVPTGSTGIVCTYSAGTGTQVVVIDFASGPVASSFISQVVAGEQQSAQTQGATFANTNVSGVGSQAVIVTLSMAGSPTENGLVAVSGNTGLAVTVSPPVSQTQLESFGSQLLG